MAIALREPLKLEEMVHSYWPDQKLSRLVEKTNSAEYADNSAVQLIRRLLARALEDFFTAENACQAHDNRVRRQSAVGFQPNPVVLEQRANEELLREIATMRVKGHIFALRLITRRHIMRGVIAE